jgi:hypothetical protein
MRVNFQLLEDNIADKLIDGAVMNGARKLDCV